jgi:FtsP/CotA-like multicopper oxidase with cupredoxin domain
VIADGVKRGFLSLNFQLPGPTINVCKGDTIIVELTNEAEGTATTIHWHGIHQRDTQYMDGVPWVTQCPIQFGLKFRYQFKVEEEGTHYYHSHAGHQHANGIYGALVVRAPKDYYQNHDIYDFDEPEHLMIVTDW